jgi:ribosomal-protein-alanine acetyltransferase
VDTFEIRAMAAADLDQVIAIESAVYPHPWSRGNFVDSLQAAYDASVCLSGERVLAYWLLMHAPDASHLLNFGVEPSRQRQGLGSRLLNRLLGALRAQRVDAVVLEVRPSNLGALALYERAGFERIGVRRGYYPAADRQREDAIVMRRDLSQLEAWGSSQ